MEHKKKLTKILCISLGFNTTLLSIILTRGGQDNPDLIPLINVDFLIGKRDLPSGEHYVNSRKLMDYLYSVFHKKAKKKVIVITASALCHVLITKEPFIDNVPLMVNEFIQFSSLPL